LRLLRAVQQRREDQYFWEALSEITEIGREARLPVHVSHIKLGMTRWWGQADRLVNVLDAARASGIDMTVDIYQAAGIFTPESR